MLNVWARTQRVVFNAEINMPQLLWPGSCGDQKSQPCFLDDGEISMKESVVVRSSLAPNQAATKRLSTASSQLVRNP